MQERVRELELNYRRHLRKKRFKIFLLAVFLLFILSGSYLGILFYENQNELFAKVLQEKMDLKKKLDKARVEQEKDKIFKEKIRKESIELKEPEFSKSDGKEADQPKRIRIDSIPLNVVHLRKSFYQNPSYEKAVFMSRTYYENKDYEKAIFWALKANEFDKSSQESWLLFSKAKEALGEIQDAQKVMEIWEEHYGSLESEE